LQIFTVQDSQDIPLIVLGQMRSYFSLQMSLPNCCRNSR
jgi:hypothetical protein